VKARRGTDRAATSGKSCQPFPVEARAAVTPAVHTSKIMTSDDDNADQPPTMAAAESDATTNVPAPMEAAPELAWSDEMPAPRSGRAPPMTFRTGV
jgi:hypothetical protein